MRARIKVTDLNLRQWDYVTTQIEVTGREFLPGVPRVCVVYELTPDFSEIHVEMDVAEFLTHAVRLESIRNEVIAVAEATLTPDTDALPSVGIYPGADEAQGR